MATPHNEANKEDIAKIVLTSGDPKRCEYIANKFLKDVQLVNSVRGMTAYTGNYKGTRITVFPMGMGMPSLGIYAFELYNFYDVDIIIRVGTCGSPNPDIDLLDLILLEGSYTESNYATSINRDYDTHISYADLEFNKILEETAKELGFDYKVGLGICSDVFDVYLSEDKYMDMLNHWPKDMNFVAVEMEAFALFYIAKMLNKKAACLLTVVDSRYNKEKVISSKERETKLDNMIKIALKSSLKF